MTRVKSLRFNLKDGVDVRNHRTHRSQKGRNLFNKDNSPFYFLYKKRKKELEEEKFDEIVA